MSFAASQEGVGRSFGIQEVLDQIGAFAGPVLLYLVMLFQTDGTTFAVYSRCFAVLAIPGGDHNPAAALHAHEVPEPRTL